MAMATKDELNELFRSRFQGHELAVDPGLWTVITAQLAATAPLNDEGLRDLFQERFQGHEATVDPGAWEGISSQLGQGTAAGAAATGGWSAGLGWAAAGVGVLAIAGASWWALRDEPGTATTPTPTVAEQQAATEAPATFPLTEAPAEADAVAAAAVPEAASPAAANPPALVAMTQQTTVPTPTPDQDQAPMGETVAAAPVAEPEHTPQPPVSEVYEPARTEAEVQEGLRVVEAILAEMTTRPATPAEPALRPREEETVEPFAEEATPEVDNPPAALPGNVTLFIPNVFTPNDDLENDRLEVQGAGFERVTVRIFSASTGAKVFEANDLRAWDGFDLNGRRCPEGHYFYAIEAMDAQGLLHTRGQVIMLSR